MKKLLLNEATAYICFKGVYWTVDNNISAVRVYSAHAVPVEIHR